MEGEHALETMLILLSSSTVFTEAYPTPPARFAGTLVASGRCDTEHARVYAQARSLLLGRVGGREKTLHPQSERDKCLCGKVSMSDTVCVFVGACERKGEIVSCISSWEIKPGHSIQPKKTLISSFDKRGIESLFQSQPPTEKTAGKCCTQVSQHWFRSGSPNTNILINVVICCHLQSTSQTTNPQSCNKLLQLFKVTQVLFGEHIHCLTDLLDHQSVPGLCYSCPNSTGNYQNHFLCVCNDTRSISITRK